MNIMIVNLRHVRRFLGPAYVLMITDPGLAAAIWGEQSVASPLPFRASIAQALADARRQRLENHK